VQPWDALICTSAAVKDNVQRVLQAQAEHLARRLGAARLVLPQLPVIPLGIHSNDFVFSSAQRAEARSQLVLGDALVVLYLGRLSFHAKAHPLAMYQALERARSKLPAGQELVLLECGWHANEAIRQAFAEAAAVACPSVRVVTLDGRIAGSARRLGRRPMCSARFPITFRRASALSPWRLWLPVSPWWSVIGTDTATACATVSTVFSSRR